MAEVSLIVGTTLANWAPNIVENISDRNDFYRHYKEADEAAGDGRKGMVVVDGGYEFRETLITNLNSTFGGYADRGTIRTDVGNPIKEAQYSHKIIAGTINISLLEEAQNNGDKNKIRDLSEVKKEEAEISMTEVMGAAALSDGTTDTTIPGGLQQAITPATNGTYGTIDSSLNSFWRPQRDTSGVTAWNTSNEGLIALDALFEQCARGGQKPDLIVTTPAVKSLINIMNVLRLTINANMGDLKGKLGVDDVWYRGARVVSDDNVPTGFLYLINTRHFRFKVLSKGNFEMTKMKQPIDGLYNVMQLFVFCNFTCSARRMLGIMTAING